MQHIKTGWVSLIAVVLVIIGLAVGFAGGPSVSHGQDGTPSLPYTIVDTGQDQCYDLDGAEIACPTEGTALAGQDAGYAGVAPSYQDNGDGTISDLNTGLMWQQTPGAKVCWADAIANADRLNLGGHTDWRVPTIKELYSLMNFNGVTGMTEAASIPYLDTTYFDFEYGDESAGERLIDAQYWSATEYVSVTMNNDATVFGVNFADGRIKGYPKFDPRTRSDYTLFVRYVRGNPNYGINDFADNGDGTITDAATGLMWMQVDSGALGAGTVDWAGALAWCAGLDYAAHNDWRLPNAKELQSLVDYSRSPDTTNSAAIDPIFAVTAITDEGGGQNYPFYWTSTTHLDGPTPGNYAVYVTFGEALGFMEMPPNSGNRSLLDVHGAGAQRSDPKAGDPSAFPTGFGPQGDVIRIYHMARCVR